MVLRRLPPGAFSFLPPRLDRPAMQDVIGDHLEADIPLFRLCRLVGTIPHIGTLHIQIQPPLALPGPRIVNAVRGFLLRHGARFQSTFPKADEVHDRAGFVNHPEGEWFFTEEGLKEAAPGHDAVTIARALRDAGHLFTDKENRLTIKVRIHGQRPRLFAVNSSILEGQEQIGAK